MTIHLRRFRAFTLLALIAVYILITIGSGVRASGAGMGCPDWPTCFGMIVPPVSESQLPANYRELYADRGYANQPFNAVKTWIEFGNRLAGVSTGFFILLAFIYCLFFVRKKKLIVVSGAVLIATIIQGWLGSVLVSSNLHPIIISTHMLLALFIVAGLHSQLEFTQQPIHTNIRGGLWLITLALITIIQIGFGLGVREQIDTAAIIYGNNRESWISSLDSIFSIHMLVAFLLSAGVIASLLLFNHRQLKSLTSLLYIWLGALVLSLVSGLAMYLFTIPIFFQPLHLLGASLQFGLLYHIILRLKRNQSPFAKRVTN